MKNIVEFAVCGIGFFGEYAGTAFAKSQYGKKPMNWDSLGKKLRNSSPKNMGYLLITYFK